MHFNEDNTGAVDTTSKTKLRIKLNGIQLESDMAELVFGPALESGNSLQDLRVKINDKVKAYDRMCYTTNVETAGLIFSNMSIRSSSLSNANLNDKKEKERVGVSQFAGGRFITCFSHIDHEIVPFWAYYGGNEKDKKILLQFRNFARCFGECINTDYCLIEDHKKVFFYSDEYKQTVKHNCAVGQMIGLPQINADFDIRNCIRSIEVFDVDYVPSDDSVFTDNYCGTTDIDIGGLSNNPEQTLLKDIKTFMPECLGKQKSRPWDYEKESRILCSLNLQDFSEWNYIDLRLKQEMFRDLVIILSPWADNDLGGKVEEIIKNSILPDEIKKSIKIEHSELVGTLNL